MALHSPVAKHSTVALFEPAPIQTALQFWSTRVPGQLGDHSVSLKEPGISAVGAAVQLVGGLHCPVMLVLHAPVAKHLVDALPLHVQVALQFEPTAVPAQLSGHVPLDSVRVGLAVQLTAAGQAVAAERGAHKTQAAVRHQGKHIQCMREGAGGEETQQWEHLMHCPPRYSLGLQIKPTVPAQLSGHVPLDKVRLGLAVQLTAAVQRRRGSAHRNRQPSHGDEVENVDREAGERGAGSTAVQGPVGQEQASPSPNLG